MLYRDGISIANQLTQLQNSAEIGDIKCTEQLRPVILGPSQRIAYLELHQHLLTNDMTMERPHGRSNYRERQIDEILSNHESPEDALIASAAYCSTQEQESLELRKQDYLNAERMMEGLLQQAEALKSALSSAILGGNEREIAQQVLVDYSNWLLQANGNKEADDIQDPDILVAFKSFNSVITPEETVNMQSKELIQKLKGEL